MRPEQDKASNGTQPALEWSIGRQLTQRSLYGTPSSQLGDIGKQVFTCDWGAWLVTYASPLPTLADERPDQRTMNANCLCLAWITELRQFLTMETAILPEDEVSPPSPNPCNPFLNVRSPKWTGRQWRERTRDPVEVTVRTPSLCRGSLKPCTSKWLLIQSQIRGRGYPVEVQHHRSLEKSKAS